jgi:hypothetical protein
MAKANLRSYKSSTGKEMNTRLIAKNVREQLKKEFPKCKFSVVASTVRTLEISLMSAPFEVFAPLPGNKDQHATMSEFTLRDPFEKHTGLQISSVTREWEEIPAGFATCNGEYISKEAWKVLQRAVIIGTKENWDRSDSQSDYYDVNYYFSIQVGKWDKPFTVK